MNAFEKIAQDNGFDLNDTEVLIEFFRSKVFELPEAQQEEITKMLLGDILSEAIDGPVAGSRYCWRDQMVSAVLAVNFARNGIVQAVP